MEVLVDRVAGLDVHKKTVTACVRVPGEGRERVEHKRTFPTFRADLESMRDWLVGLTNDCDYHDLGSDWYDAWDPKARTRSLVRQLEALGHHVVLDPAA